ncbi:MAG: flagellar hook-basal body protein [Vulcanibacillus sp.]
MNNSLISSLVSMQSMQKKIDTIANNIANVDTVGFKSSTLYFEDIMSEKMIQPQGFNLEGRKTTLGLTQGFGVKNSSMLTDFSQGNVKETGIPSDIMLQGEDIFFTIVKNGGEPYESDDWTYTRNGHFQVDAYGYLVTDQGEYVLSTEDEPLQIPENSTYTVDSQGLLTATNVEGEVEEVGTLKITKFNNSQILKQIGNNKYQIPEEFNTGWFDLVDRDFSFNSDSSGRYAVIQGSLEGSNIDLTKELTELNNVQRTYQLLSGGISISNQMMSITNKLRG